MEMFKYKKQTAPLASMLENIQIKKLPP